MSPVSWVTLATTLHLCSLFSPVYKVQELIPSYPGSLPILKFYESVYLMKYLALVIHLGLSRREQFLRKGKLIPLWSSHPVFILLKIRFWLNAIFKFRLESGNTCFFHYQTVSKSHHSTTGTAVLSYAVRCF